MADIFGKSWSYHLYKHVLFDVVTAEYKAQAHEELHDPTNNRQKVVWPWKGTIVSGVWSEKTKDKVMDQYFKEDEVKRTNLRKHREHHGKWIKAEKARKLHEKIYG